VFPGTFEGAAEAMHVLLVEGDKKLLKLLKTGLRERGIKVQTAENLEETFTRLAQCSFDAILLDLSLSDSQGIETYHRVRELVPAVPILVATDLDEEELALKAIEQGAQGHVLKQSVSSEAIHRRIEFAIEETRVGQALQKSEKRLRIILENSYDAFMSVDRQWQITDWNPQAETTFGWSKQEALGRPLSSIVPRHLRKQYAKLVEKRFDKGDSTVLRANYELQAINNEGRQFPIEFVIFKIKEDQDYLYCAFVRDITDRKRLSEDLERQVAERTERLTQSNEELKQFAKIASHDLQEPLRAVQGFANLLKENTSGKLDKDSEEFVDFILDGTKRMQNLIQAVLMHSSISKDDSTDHVTKCNDVIEDVLTNLSATIGETQASFDIDNLPEVAVERSHLVQLFQNLISNALKYRSKDRVPHIVMKADTSGDYWLFSVRDNGIGIDPRYTDKIFDMFARLHGKTEYSGTGMGLAICKRIVTSHGGTISVESIPGEGSIFLFTLPGILRNKENIE